MIVKHLMLATGIATLLAAPPIAIRFADGGPTDAASSPAAAVETITIAAGSSDYALPGEFVVDGRPVSAPVERAGVDRPIAIMKHQVSLADYRRCVEAGACAAADAAKATGNEAGLLPVTGVSFLDAQAYAGWYSRETGEHWRLPTDAEWAHAAAERFAGESYSAESDDPANPAVAWIRRYREEAAASRKPDPLARRFGHFGPNTRGIDDLAGNVWEWTATCYARTTLDAERRTVVHRTENCGVHVAEGRHRAYLSNFIRDGKSGGCAVGSPPQHLGFRLVRDQPRRLRERLLDLLQGTIFDAPVS